MVSYNASCLRRSCPTFHSPSWPRLFPNWPVLHHHLRVRNAKRFRQNRKRCRDPQRGWPHRPSIAGAKFPTILSMSSLTRSSSWPNHVHGILTIPRSQATSIRGSIEDGHGVSRAPTTSAERFQLPTVGADTTVVRSYKQTVTYLARKHLNRPSLAICKATITSGSFGTARSSQS